MPKGIYKHKPHQGFQKENTIGIGNKYRLGKSPWCKGKHLSEETKFKISKIRKINPVRYWLDKKRPDISEMKKGMKFSEEWKNNLGVYTLKTCNNLLHKLS